MQIDLATAKAEGFGRNRKSSTLFERKLARYLEQEECENKRQSHYERHLLTYRWPGNRVEVFLFLFFFVIFGPLFPASRLLIVKNPILLSHVDTTGLSGKVLWISATYFFSFDPYFLTIRARVLKFELQKDREKELGEVITNAKTNAEDCKKSLEI